MVFFKAVKTLWKLPGKGMWKLCFGKSKAST